MHEPRYMVIGHTTPGGWVVLHSGDHEVTAITKYRLECEPGQPNLYDEIRLVTTLTSKRCASPRQEKPA